MKNNKLNSSMRAMRMMAEGGGLKGYMNGGDVTDSLIKAQKGGIIGGKGGAPVRNIKAEQRAKDSANTADKLTNEYWNQTSVRMNPLKNRNGWFGEGNTTDPGMKQYVGRGMQKAGFEPQPSTMASKGYLGDAMKKLSKKKMGGSTYSGPAKKSMTYKEQQKKNSPYSFPTKK